MMRLGPRCGLVHVTVPTLDHNCSFINDASILRILAKLANLFVYFKNNIPQRSRLPLRSSTNFLLDVFKITRSVTVLR